MYDKERMNAAYRNSCFGLMFGALASAQDVRINYMPGTDFAKYHTYAWVEEAKGVSQLGGQRDQILDTQVKQAVDSQRAAKGFTKVADATKAAQRTCFAMRSNSHGAPGSSHRRADLPEGPSEGGLAYDLFAYPWLVK
jgi:hypothetical protein